MTRARALASHPLLLVVVVLPAAALLGAAAAAAGKRLVVVPTPSDALPATAATAVALFAHNAGVALWPLAITTLQWPRMRVVRELGDTLVGAQLVGHGALIGNAILQQPALWRYLPHLPAEWLGIALPCAAWVAARYEHELAARHHLRVAAISVALLAIAAVIETYLVPIP
jgi:hypothetical protein